MIPCFIFYRNPEYAGKHISHSPFNSFSFILTLTMLKVKFLSYLLFSPVWQKASRTSYKSLLLVCNLQICVSFLPDIFPSQVFFVLSWLPPCFQKFIWQVHERMCFLHIIKMNTCYAWQQKKDTFHWYFYQKRSVPLYTLFWKMLLKNNQYFTCKQISQTVKNPWNHFSWLDVYDYQTELFFLD